MDFFELVQKRHSVRKFTDEQISSENIEAIISATQTAPSAKNTKSSAFMIIEDHDTLKALSELRTSGGKFIADADKAIVVLGDETKTDLWRENCSISATFVQLAATALGIGSCWVHVHGRKRSKDGSVEGMAEDYVRGLLGIKENMRILCIIALGYEASEE